MLSESRVAIRVSAVVIVAVLWLAVTEITARLLFHWHASGALSEFATEYLGVEPDLDPYEVQDSERPYHWRPRAGYSATTRQLIAEKVARGKTLGAAVISDDAVEAESLDEVRVRINSHGFKGPELDQGSERVRILAIGDSTTFGSGPVEYPRPLEDYLRSKGYAVEVVNGGVEGYAPKNALWELPRFRSIDPDVTIIFLGWNGIFADKNLERKAAGLFMTPWLLSKVAEALKVAVSGDVSVATAKQNLAKHPNLSDPAIESVGELEMPSFDSFEQIAEQMKSGGSEVFLLTLPGLYRSDAEPNERALRIGHLPGYTDNPYVLAAYADAYNRRIIDLGQRLDMPVIDLAEWSKNAFVPRDKYFSDSVHIRRYGFDIMVPYVGDSLIAQSSRVRASIDGQTPEAPKHPPKPAASEQ